MNALQLEIARFLAWKAIAKKRTTYQELAEAIGWPHPTGRGLGKNLYAVLHYMHDKRLPPLTTILVRKGHRYPDDDALDYIREAIGAVDIADADDVGVQAILRQAYEKKLLRGGRLLSAKRLVEARQKARQRSRIN